MESSSRLRSQQWDRTDTLQHRWTAARLDPQGLPTSRAAGPRPSQPRGQHPVIYSFVCRNSLDTCSAPGSRRDTDGGNTPGLHTARVGPSTPSGGEGREGVLAGAELKRQNSGCCLVQAYESEHVTTYVLQKFTCKTYRLGKKAEKRSKVYSAHLSYIRALSLGLSLYSH